MRYFTFIRAAENQGPLPAGFDQAMEGFITKHLQDGTLVQTAGLSPSSRGVRIRMSKAKLTLTDGPFAEAKEVIGGYAILEASTREKAIEIGRAFMQLHLDHWPEFEGEAEIRAMDFVAP
ncbi:MAG TPA: YciI family protein [Gemmatimonadales bacterium]|nr:YciI family protein [Gemmatimonadales bacterium]